MDCLAPGHRSEQQADGAGSLSCLPSCLTFFDPGGADSVECIPPENWESWQPLRPDPSLDTWKQAPRRSLQKKVGIYQDPVHLFVRTLDDLFSHCRETCLLHWEKLAEAMP